MTPNYLPDTSDVASLLRARAVDAYGNHLDDFTDATSPTQAQAESLIAEAGDEVSQEIGDQVSITRIGQAKRLTTLLAAANIELSFYPEQAAATNSMYDKLLARYNELLPRMGEDVAEDDEVENSTYGGFPPSSNFGTRRW